MEVDGFHVVQCEADGMDGTSVIDTVVLATVHGVTERVATIASLELDGSTMESDVRVLGASVTRSGEASVVRIHTASAWSSAIADAEDGEQLHELVYRERVTVCVEDVLVACPVQGALVRELSTGGAEPQSFELGRLASRARAVGRVDVGRDAIVVRRGDVVERHAISRPTSVPIDVRELLASVARDELRAFALARGGIARSHEYGDVYARLRVGRTEVVLWFEAGEPPILVGRARAGVPPRMFVAALSRELRRVLPAPRIFTSSHLGLTNRYELFGEGLGALLLMRVEARLYEGPPSDDFIRAMLAPFAL